MVSANIFSFIYFRIEIFICSKNKGKNKGTKEHKKRNQTKQKQPHKKERSSRTISFEARFFDLLFLLALAFHVGSCVCKPTP